MRYLRSANLAARQSMAAMVSPWAFRTEPPHALPLRRLVVVCVAALVSLSLASVFRSPVSDFSICRQGRPCCRTLSADLFPAELATRR